MYWVTGYNSKGLAVFHLLAGKNETNALVIKGRMLRDPKIASVSIRKR